MEKKLTAQGPKKRKSYTVTLPIEWVKEQGLDKTRTVDLNIVGNKAIISSTKEVQERIMIEGKEYKDSIIKVLQGLYKAGVNEIKWFLVGDELEQILDIIEKRLIGYEIVEQKKEFIIIKEITKESDENFKVVFRRIFLLILEFQNCRDLKMLGSLDRNIKKLINYCQRILVKKGHTEFNKTHLYYLILDRLEKITDEYRWLLEIMISKKKVYSILKEINGALEIVYKLFYKYEAQKYNEYVYGVYKLRHEIKLGEKVDNAVIHLHNLARLLNSLYGDIYILKF